MFGRKARRIAELLEFIEALEFDIKWWKDRERELVENLNNEKIRRMNAEAQLEQARRGEDEEANHFFRFGVKPKRETQEPLTDAGAGAIVAKKARAKKN